MEAGVRFCSIRIIETNTQTFIVPSDTSRNHVTEPTKRNDWQIALRNFTENNKDDLRCFGRYPVREIVLPHDYVRSICYLSKGESRSSSKKLKLCACAINRCAAFVFFRRKRVIPNKYLSDWISYAVFHIQNSINDLENFVRGEEHKEYKIHAFILSGVDFGLHTEIENLLKENKNFSIKEALYRFVNNGEVAYTAADMNANPFAILERLPETTPTTSLSQQFLPSLPWIDTDNEFENFFRENV